MFAKRLEMVERIMEKCGLSLSDQGRLTNELNDENIRYFHVSCRGFHGDPMFLKILADWDNERNRRDMIREVLVHKYIYKQLKNKPSPFMGIAYLYESVISPKTKEVYMVVKAYPQKDYIGFTKSEEDMEKLGDYHGYSCTINLMAMQDVIDTDQLIADIDLELKSLDVGFADAQELLRDFYDDFSAYQENTLVILSMIEPEYLEDGEIASEDLARCLENHGNPEDEAELLKGLSPWYQSYLNLSESEFGKVPLWMILEKRLQAKDFRKSVTQMLEAFRPIVEFFQAERLFLIHGDCCPRNTFYGSGESLEFIDWGHAGLTKNRLLALIHDFGNMRARAWNNQAYREAMDEAVLEHFQKVGLSQAGKAVVALGILRSHCSLAGYFENYPIAKQRLEQEKRRKESTELDLYKAFSIAGIEL